MNESSRTHRWPWVLGLILLIGTAVGATWGLNQGRAPVGDKEEKDPTPPGVVCIGFVDGVNGVANLHPLQPGRVIWIAREGDVLQEGDKILQIDPRLAEAKVKEAEADLKNAEELVEKARLLPQQYKFEKAQQLQAIEAARALKEAAEEELKGREEGMKLSVAVRKAYEANITRAESAMKVEESKLQLLELRDPQLDIRRAESDVKAKQAQLEQANIGLEETTLRTPKGGGTVLRVLVQAGEVLGPSPKMPAIQFLPRINTDQPESPPAIKEGDALNPNDIIVRAEVLQEWAEKVKPGQKVVIEDDTYAGPKWEGKVLRLARYFTHKRNIMIEPFMVNDVRTMECIIEIISDTKDLRIGQRVRARIITN